MPRYNPLNQHERWTDENGQEWVRDGSVKFRVEDAEAAGWDVNNIDPSLAVPNDSPNSAAGKNKARRQKVAVWNDQNWNPGAKEMGFSDWRAAQKALVNSDKFKALSPNEQHYALRAGPNIWKEYYGLASLSPTATNTNRPAPNPNMPQPGIPIQIPGAAVDPASVGAPPTVPTMPQAYSMQKPGFAPDPYQKQMTNKPLQTNRPPQLGEDTFGQYNKPKKFGALNV